MLTRRDRHPDAYSCQRTVNCGLKTVTIRTVGTDVVLLDVAHFQGLPNIEQLWISFGTGKEFKYIPIHKIASAICPQFAKEMLSFHAFTGCDVTSYFTQRKKSAWKTAYMSTLRHSYGDSVILASLKTSVPETKISVI